MKGRRTIRDAGRTPVGVDKGGNMGRGSRHTTVIETGKFYKTSIMRGTPPSGSDMDNYGASEKGRGVVQIYRSCRGDM